MWCDGVSRFEVWRDKTLGLYGSGNCRGQYLLRSFLNQLGVFGCREELMSSLALRWFQATDEKVGSVLPDEC